MPHQIHRIAYAVTDVSTPNGERRNRWHQVGVSFLNKDGSETVLLDAAPLSGKVILQVPKADVLEPAVQEPMQSSDQEDGLAL